MNGWTGPHGLVYWEKLKASEAGAGVSVATVACAANRASSGTSEKMRTSVCASPACSAQVQLAAHRGLRCHAHLETCPCTSDGGGLLSLRIGARVAILITDRLFVHCEAVFYGGAVLTD